MHLQGRWSEKEQQLSSLISTWGLIWALLPLRFGCFGPGASGFQKHRIFHLFFWMVGLEKKNKKNQQPWPTNKEPLMYTNKHTHKHTHTHHSASFCQKSCEIIVSPGFEHAIMDLFKQNIGSFSKQTWRVGCFGRLRVCLERKFLQCAALVTQVQHNLSMWARTSWTLWWMES